MEMAMNPNVVFFGPGGGFGGGFGGPGGPGGPGGFGHGPGGPGRGPGGFFGGPHGPGGFGHGPGGFGHGPHGPGGPGGFGHGPGGPGRGGPMMYGGNPMMFHHSFHGPGFYGFMHRPGFFYAGPMHHHPGGWSFFGPYWGYRGFAGPEFYFGRARDPFFGPHRGPFIGAYYHGWFRGYGWRHPRTWMGGWFGFYPMGAPNKDASLNEDDNQEALLGLETGGEPAAMQQPKGLFDRLYDWWDSL